MKIKEIVKFLDEKYPTSIAEEWDNVGFLIGDKENELKSIVIALELTDDVIEKAISIDANLIITHHPLIFNSIKKITNDTTLGKKILKLIKNNISVYSLHTNIDLIRDGLNDYVGKLVFPDIENSEILIWDKKNLEFGLGRVYNLESYLSINELIEILKDRLNLKNLRFIGSSKEKKIKKVAIINGAGASYWKKANSKGVDILITGDIKYHEGVEAKELEFPMIDIGHYESEIFFIELLDKILKDEFSLEIKKIEGVPVFELV